VRRRAREGAGTRPRRAPACPACLRRLSLLVSGALRANSFPFSSPRCKCLRWDVGPSPGPTVSLKKQLIVFSSVFLRLARRKLTDFSKNRIFSPVRSSSGVVRVGPARDRPPLERDAAPERQRGARTRASSDCRPGKRSKIYYSCSGAFKLAYINSVWICLDF
jgi:hypothetical protein